MRRTRLPIDPVLQRRVAGGVAVYLGLGGLYTAFQVHRGSADAELTGVLLVVAAALLSVTVGTVAILRPVRAAGWLVRVAVVLLILAYAGLSFLWSRPGY
ncbi:hypothetical protein [Cryptosporangium aurantiacum]|uniref:Uncharacterized protein n=1 Tax=Cryptosporangium aurantiacum TaxID=134849 RepID=A0A1M7P7G0_9ACTN|nr:hypothetical protein [Cryptosporangium aurantiacum]SHN12331.1 hypothetical protein SAMN05443668_1033 [Cryptosporangium aurantiacum]